MDAYEWVTADEAYKVHICAAEVTDVKLTIFYVISRGSLGRSNLCSNFYETNTPEGRDYNNTDVVISINIHHHILVNKSYIKGMHITVQHCERR